MKKVYMIKYVEVDPHAFGYEETVNFERVAFTDFRAASYFLLNLEFKPSWHEYAGETPEERYELTWKNVSSTWAEINELTVIG